MDPIAGPKPLPSTGGSVEFAFAWTAVGFAVISIPGALAWLPAFSSSDNALSALLADFAPVTAVLSWIFALAATVIAGVALIARRRGRRTVLALGMAAPGAALGTVAIVMAVGLVGGMLGLTQGNPAQDVAKSALGSYTAGGASVICDNGDNGHGIDNRSPWYEAYVDVPAALGTKSQAAAALHAAGFRSVVVGKATTDYGDAGPSESFAVRSLPGARSASVSVYPSGSVPLYCSGSVAHYGELHTSNTGHVLVDISVNFPPTD